MLTHDSAVVLDLPLKGNWVAQNTPAEKIPSHGTDAYGQRYAYDFVRFDAEWDLPYTPRAFWVHLLKSVRAEEFLCWNQPVTAAFEGSVVGAVDDCADRQTVNLCRDLIRGLLFPPLPKGGDIRPLAGNYVLVEGEEGVALYAHLRQGSVCVEDGQYVRRGDQIGTVGNSGNSTMPHLHFHLMDSANFGTAAGLLCAFREYERRVNGEWERVVSGIPRPLERIRRVAPYNGLQGMETRGLF